LSFGVIPTWGQYHVKVGFFAVNSFVQMNLDNTVVVQLESLANAILCNFEPTIQIPTQCRTQVEPHEEYQVVRFKQGTQTISLWVLGERH